MIEALGILEQCSNNSQQGVIFQTGIIIKMMIIILLIIMTMINVRVP